MAVPGQWLDLELDRVLAEQKAGVDTAKLLVTFSAAIAAAMAAAALQSARGHPVLRFGSSWGFVLSAVLAVVVFLLDRLDGPNFDGLAVLGARGLSQTAMHREIRIATYAAVDFNKSVVTSVRMATAVQVAVSLATAGIAVQWLLVSVQG